jgi:hypothetical protein
VTEVKDVAGKTLGFVEHLLRRPEHDVNGGKTDSRVEVALEGNSRSDPTSGDIERNAPVNPDDVGSGLGHEPEQLAGSDTEVDSWDTEVCQAFEDAAGRRKYEFGVFVSRQNTYPAVEELNR